MINGATGVPRAASKANISVVTNIQARRVGDKAADITERRGRMNSAASIAGTRARGVVKPQGAAMILRIAIIRTNAAKSGCTGSRITDHPTISGDHGVVAENGNTVIAMSPAMGAGRNSPAVRKIMRTRIAAAFRAFHAEAGVKRAGATVRADGAMITASAKTTGRDIANGFRNTGTSRARQKVNASLKAFRKNGGSGNIQRDGAGRRDKVVESECRHAVRVNFKAEGGEAANGRNITTGSMNIAICRQKLKEKGNWKVCRRNGAAGNMTIAEGQRNSG
jgi:hypothetical protein